MSNPGLAEHFLRERLRYLRKQAGLTQEATSELAGISSIYYQSIEAGRRPNVSLRMMEKIAAAYGISIHELFAPQPPRIKISKTPSAPPHRFEYKRSKKKKKK